MDARPTTDYAKEGLFNVLQHSVPLEGIDVLDLFAGTGSIAIEFLSRGAANVLSVDQDRELYAHLLRTAGDLKEEHWRIVRSDVFSFLAAHRARYDIVFADPPFGMDGIERIPTLVLEGGLLAPDGLLIVEHPARMNMSALPGFSKHRPYGAVHFSFFKPLPST
jgi:16S rRNA (guanine(966)-N(2))-methyltransferase RsmD